ncbi:MAG: hypothetical protein ACRYG7_18645 [Janthinobacterium lividum]
MTEKLGVAPKHYLVFENVILGEHAAYQADMHCAAILTNLTVADFQAPLLTIRDFMELKLEQLRELFN